MSDVELKKRRGRPAKPMGEDARGALTIRLRKEVRRDVETAAVKYGRSLSEEIEARLESSFEFKQYIKQEWGDDIFRIAGTAAASLSFIETWADGSWTENESAYQIFLLTLSEIVKNYRDHIAKAAGRKLPTGDLDGKSPQEQAQMFAALGGLAPPRPKPKGRVDQGSEE